MPIGILFWVMSMTPSVLDGSTGTGHPLSASTFGNHVVNVVALGSNEEVLESDARWVVAGVQDFEIIRDGSILDFVGNTMSQQIVTFLRSRTDDAVAVFVRAANPNDATIRRSVADVSKKTNIKRNCLPEPLAFFGAKTTSAQGDLARGSVERESFAASIAQVCSVVF